MSCAHDGEHLRRHDAQRRAADLGQRGTGHRLAEHRLGLGRNASASHVQLSGAVSGVLTNAANCAKHSDQNTIVITDTLNGKLDLFQIVTTHYHDASTHTTGPTEGEPIVNVNAAPFVELRPPRQAVNSTLD